MLNYKGIYVVGYSGHSYVVLDVAIENKFKPLGYFEKTFALNNPYDIPFLGKEQDLDIKKLVLENIVFPAVGNNSIRQRICAFLDQEELVQQTLVSKSASVSPMAKIGLSTFVGAMATINSMANIGKGCIINTGAVIEHETYIGNYAHIAPGSVLAGNVTIGDSSFIGANTVVREGIMIGNNAVIGAGSVVVRNVPANEVWIGNPAKKYKNNG